MKRPLPQIEKPRTPSSEIMEIIGEAAGKLPEEIQKAAPEIDWRKIKALRNILIHDYFGVNLPIVWDVVQNKLGPLEATCRKLQDLNI